MIWGLAINFASPVSTKKKFMENILKQTILTILLATIAFIGAAHAQTKTAAATEGCDEYAKADAELNKVYAEVLREYAGEKTFVAKLKQAQRAWLAFTDAHLASLYPNGAAAYGTVNRACRCQVKTDFTRERIKQLRQWLDGTPEGDVCGGSIKRTD